MYARSIISAAWLAFAVVWFAAAPWSRQTVEKESLSSRLSFAVPMILSCLLIFPGIGEAPAPWLALRWHARSALIAYLGAALTAAGVAWAIWARAHLGRLWSGRVTLKEGHRLVQTGPYNITRHPIYTGMLVALMGTAIASGKLRALLGFAFACGAMMRKLMLEERLLARAFGEEAETYRKRVRALIPWVW